MKARHALIAFLSCVAVLGTVSMLLATHGTSQPQWLQIVSAILFSLLTFAWFCLDSGARSYRRSPFLNIAIVGIGFVAVPYYLIVSRQKGERLKAIGRFAGFGLAMLAALMAGTFIGLILS